jgi:hypothetical protein
VFRPEIEGFGSGDIIALEVDFGDGTIRQFPPDQQTIRHHYKRP